MRYLALLITVLLLAGCEEETSQPKFDDSQGDATDFVGHWLIPVNEIDNSPDAMDVIPSIDEPQFINISQANDLNKTDRVLVYKNKSTVKIYPHKYIRNREIANDMTGGTAHAVTFCPITASGINWNRKIAGQVTEFGVSGMLYNRNLMPYDRNTNSFWSQMMLKCVNGAYINKSPKVLNLLETNWSTAKLMYDNALVLQSAKKSTACEDCPSAGNYKGEAVKSDTLYGIVGTKDTYLFDYDHFKKEVTVRRSNASGEEYILAGSKTYEFIIGFNPKGTEFAGRNFEAITGKLPQVMKDEMGNVYTIFGEVVQGPDKGETIPVARGYTAKFFAWEDFFPDYKIPFE